MARVVGVMLGTLALVQGHRDSVPNERNMTVAIYGDDLAHAHEAGFQDLAYAAADRLIEELGRSKPDGGVIVDLGCGPGGAAARLLAARYSVICVDQSAAMLALAQAAAPRAEFVRANWADYEIPPCDAVLAAGEVLNYVTDKGITLKTVEKLFGRVHRALWPGGLFVFDMAGPGRVPGGGPVTTTAVGDDWAAIATVSEDKRGMLTRQITSLRKVKGGIRMQEEEHRQRLVPANKVLEMLRKVGFKVRSQQGYDGERFAPGHTVFIARRP